MDFNASTLNRDSVIKGENIIYHITDVLGQGSFGITYKATIKTLAKGAFGEDWVDTNTPKAIKEFFMSDINSRDDVTGNVQGFVPGGISTYYAQKFYKEARNLAKMKHPNIVKVTDFIEANDTYYYAMDYIEGDNLNHYIEQHKLSEEEAVSIINDVAGALQYMHEEHKMLHLDMKPGNVMRSKDGHIYVIDFGLSKHFNEQGEPDTSTTVGFGTEGYAPLEQGKKTQKSNDFSPTIDVYALGGTFFKLLTGKTPPSSADVLEDDTLLGSIMERHQVSPGLQKIIISAMAPSSKRRMQSVKEFRNALNDYLGETKPFENPDEKEKTAVVEMPTEKTQVVTSAQPSEKTTPVVSPVSQTSPIQPPKRKKSLIYIILALVIAVVTGGVIALVATNSSKWESNLDYSEGLAAVKDDNDKFGYIDKTGRLVIPGQWDVVGCFMEGLAPVMGDNGKFGYIDKTGRLVIPYKWNAAEFFSEGLAKVQDANDKWGFIDKTGRLVIPCKWEWPGDFREGLARVQEDNDKYGFIDKTGRVVIPCQWNEASWFREGLAAVMDANGWWGYIDKTGQVVIPCKWNCVEDFHEGLAKVQDANGKWFKIDKTGKVVK